MDGRFVRMWIAAAVLAAGCGREGGQGGGVIPLPVQQAGRHGEAVTGRFVSLADFEDARPAGRAGHEQVRDFSITGGDGRGQLKFVVERTRTGAGAMEVLLPPGAMAVYRLGQVHDFSRYALLSMSVYSEGVRDDLKVFISTDRAGWESLPVLLEKGWNEVQIDLYRLKAMGDFEPRGVRAIRLWFAAASEPVGFILDDVLLIDNRREITPTPAGVRLWKQGLDYVVHLPGRAVPICIRQGEDGLWRLGPDQTVMTVQAAGEGPAAEGPRPGEAREDLSVFGPRRVGRVEVLEHNALRVRLAVTWYFPTSAGEWITLAVRRIRWVYTFHGDGRLVTDVEVNNAGGAEISSVALAVGSAAAFSDGTLGAVKEARPFAGPAGRWCFLRSAAGPGREQFQANYVKPARLDVRMGEQAPGEGDADADGFDESAGCYCLRAQAGHCRFLVLPPPGGLAGAFFHVVGGWTGKVTASSAGRAVRNLVRLPDGSVLFMLEGLLEQPTWVEVTGPVGGGQER